jgi:tyrosyl-tRNA synthetase
MEDSIITMDTETRLELIKGVGEEVITEPELRDLVQTKSKIVAYDGFEPSGLAHMPFGVFRPLLLRDLSKARVTFKLWIADWFGWINNKMGGDLEKIKMVGKYFIEVWKAAGVDPRWVKFVWASENMDHEYWKRVILIGKTTTLKRATRMLSIMGRKAGELNYVAQFYYPMMQTSDIFQLQADICQLGLDQRRANILAREVGPRLGYWKPVVVSHHMLMGLEGQKTPDGFEDNKEMDIEISSKMSKSMPQTAILVHDTEKQIMQKIHAAYCAPKEIRNNPMLDYTKHLIFRAYPEMEVDRPQKFGGPVFYESYQKLEQDFRDGLLHPTDLKVAVAIYLNDMIKPIREHFEKNPKAKKLYQLVKRQEVTR